MSGWTPRRFDYTPLFPLEKHRWSNFSSEDAPRCSIRRRNLAAGERERCSEVYIYICVSVSVYTYIYMYICMLKRIILPNIAVRCPKFQGLRIGVLGVDPLVIKPLENHTSSRSGCTASGELRPDWSWRYRLV